MDNNQNIYTLLKEMSGEIAELKKDIHRLELKVTPDSILTNQRLDSLEGWKSSVSKKIDKHDKYFAVLISFWIFFEMIVRVSPTLLNIIN